MFLEMFLAAFLAVWLVCGVASAVAMATYLQQSQDASVNERFWLPMGALLTGPVALAIEFGGRAAAPEKSPQ